MQKVNNKWIRAVIAIFTIVIFGITIVPDIQVKASDEVSVSYKTHIQSKGWESDYKTDGSSSGTTGQGLRLEAIKIKVTGDENLNVWYSTYIQKKGWIDYVKNNASSGTSGKGLRLEAIKMRLSGSDAGKYDIYYRVHAQHFGWLDWAKNDEISGTSGYAYRLEAIQIKVVPKGSAAPGSVENSYRSAPATVSYRTHVQTYGFQDYVSDGATSGTVGEAKRLEAINIKVNDSRYSGSVVYKTHVQSIGWQDNVSDGEMSGTSGRALRLEAIQINLTDELAQHYDIYYRVHAQHFGWMGWAKNGDSAGTAGYAYRLEAIQIKIVNKGEEAPGSTDTPYLDKSAGTNVNTDVNTEGQDDLVYLKWNNNSNQLDIYRKAAEKNTWIRHVFIHKVSNSNSKVKRQANGNTLASCCDVWCIKGAYIATRNNNGAFHDTYEYPIVHSDAEWEMAIKEVVSNEETPDFIGGTLHGNEVVNNIVFIADGKTYNSNEVSKLDGVACKTLEIKRNSNVYRDNTLEFDSNFNPETDEPTSGYKVATHYVDYTFTHNDITIDQDLNWVVDTECSYSLMAMLGAKRVASDGKTQITDTATRDGDATEYDCSKAGVKTGIFKSMPNCKKAHLWNKGTNGGLKCDFTAEILEETDMPGKNFKISNHDLYNKFYFGYCQAGQRVAQGDTWHCKAKYTVDYMGRY